MVLLNLSYAQYIKLTKSPDTRQSWIEWKMYLGMSYPEAIVASNDKIWGYTPLEKEIFNVPEEN